MQKRRLRLVRDTAKDLRRLGGSPTDVELTRVPPRHAAYAITWKLKRILVLTPEQWAEHDHAAQLAINLGAVYHVNTPHVLQR